MKIVIAILIAFVSVFITGCAGLLGTPGINAGYYIENKTDSKTTLLIGTNNTQANAIHAALTAGANSTDSAEANEADKNATSSGLFVNNTVGNRSADVDASAALEMLKDVAGSTAGQSLNKGDSSPGTVTQTPTNAPTTTTNTPVAVSQQGDAAATTPPYQPVEPTITPEVLNPATTE